MKLLRTIFVIGLPLGGSVGCESDVAKLARLESERNTHCLLEQAYRDRYTELRHPGGVTKANLNNPHPPGADSVRSAWMEHHTKCELATREYEAFKR